MKDMYWNINNAIIETVHNIIYLNPAFASYTEVIDDVFKSLSKYMYSQTCAKNHMLSVAT